MYIYSYVHICLYIIFIPWKTKFYFKSFVFQTKTYIFSTYHIINIFFRYLKSLYDFINTEQWFYNDPLNSENKFFSNSLAASLSCLLRVLQRTQSIRRCTDATNTSRPPEFHVWLLAMCKNHWVGGGGTKVQNTVLCSDSSPIFWHQRKPSETLSPQSHHFVPLFCYCCSHWAKCEVSRKNGSEALMWKNTEMVGCVRRGVEMWGVMSDELRWQSGENQASFTSRWGTASLFFLPLC